MENQRCDIMVGFVTKGYVSASCSSEEIQTNQEKSGGMACRVPSG